VLVVEALNMAKMTNSVLVVEALSGAAGSMIVTFLFYPLENLKTRIQLVSGSDNRTLTERFQQVWEEEGLEGFYRGCPYQTFAVGCSNLIYFATYSWLKQKIVRPEIQVTLGLGIISGWANVLLTSPLWTVAMLKRHDPDVIDMDDIVRKIRSRYKSKGIFALYEPFSFVLVLVPAIHYLLYGKLRSIVVKLYGTEDLHSIMYFLVGLCAKFITTLLTYPLQLAQNMGRFKTIESLKREVNEKGYLVLFKGLKAKLLQTGVMTGFHMMFYEKMRRTLYLLFFLAIMEKRKKLHS